MAAFVQSLAFVANPHDLELLLDSGTFDFLLVIAWISDDGSISSKKTCCDHLLQ